MQNSYYCIYEDISGFNKINLPLHVEIIKTSDFFDVNDIKYDTIENIPSTVYGISSNGFRKSVNCTIHNRQWISEHLTRIINMKYKSYFGCALQLKEPLQMLMYGPDDFFKSHSDSAFLKNNEVFVSEPSRHLSVVLYLSEKTDYDGGLLSFNSLVNNNGNFLKFDKFEVGDMVVFSSDYRYQHEVSKITFGNRKCIVGWFSINE